MDTLFLVLSLFLPRITLIYCYFTHHIPFNNVPFIGDALLTVFLPRVLVLIYIVDNLGTDSPWFWIHLVAAVAVYLSGGKYSHKRYKKRG
ncbi:MAG: hypothetical protein PHN88_03340 [Ignavibacteria bacterium]|nr:hypothetical protein [Ignavibacteria bacterium]